MAPRTRVKVCCIASVEEAQCAIARGASAVGLVAKMPSGPGPISEERIAEIARQVPPGVSSFLLTASQEVEEIVAQQRRCGTNTLQLVDRLLIGSYEELRAALPGVSIVQVIHVEDEEAVDEARAVALQVDGILLDSGRPSAAVKELGGTGRAHDWAVSRRVREAVEVPVFLAGGLRSDNVALAIKTVGPFAVDVCSGVRTNGKLDVDKLDAFFAAVEQAV